MLGPRSLWDTLHALFPLLLLYCLDSVGLIRPNTISAPNGQAIRTGDVLVPGHSGGEAVDGYRIQIQYDRRKAVNAPWWRIRQVLVGTT